MQLVTDSKKQPRTLCMMVYYVPDGFQPYVAPHGNSKSSQLNPSIQHCRAPSRLFTIVNQVELSKLLVMCLLVLGGGVL